MNPECLFPVLAIFFVVVATLRFARERRFGPAARSWVILALSFAVVSAWLHTVT